MISIYSSDISKYKSSAIDAVNSGWISNHGKYVKMATDKLKEITDSKYVILMANGTAATHCLFLALKHKYPKINKIYVPNNCYVAAWNAALMVYSLQQLEIMRMCYETANIDETTITTLDKNSAVLIVHNMGNIVNVPKLKRARPDLIFVEDNCEGMFGKYEDTYSGMSDSSLCSSCSFYGNKILTTGEGGAFFTQDKAVFDHINLVYSQGMSDKKYVHLHHAYNYRMTNIEAAFLYDQLENLDFILLNKRRIFNSYDKLLSGICELKFVNTMKILSGTCNSPWIYPCWIVNNTKTIDDTVVFFKNYMIDIRPFFYPINKHDFLKTVTNNDNISYKLNQDVIMIPSSPTITMSEQLKVVDTIYLFLLHQLNMKILKLTDSNRDDIYNKCLKPLNNIHQYFRYFNKRDVSSLTNHLETVVLIDHVTEKFVAYCHLDRDETNNKTWFGIYVSESFRSRGIGKLLLSYMIFKAEHTHNLARIYLTVDKENPAISLYHKFCFEVDQTNDKTHRMFKSLS